MSTYKLNAPLTLLNGKEITELDLAYDQLTLSDLRTANKIVGMIGDSNVGNIDNGTLSPRLDPNLRTAIAFVAAIKGTPGLRVDDVLKVSMVDALCLGEDCMSNYLFK